MNLIHRSFSICLIMAICLTGLPASTADARASAGETSAEARTTPLPASVTRADWEQIQALLPTDIPAQQAYLKASNPGAGDRFGEIIAISGDTIVVGAPWESSNAMGVNGDPSNDLAQYAGAAYVFVRDGTTWSQQAYLKASNTEAADLFGGGVAISGDTIVVGATGEDSNATGVNGDQSNNLAGGAGAAYVFVRSGTTWSQQAYLKASNTQAGDSFGRTLVISGDTIVVEAIYEDSNATGVNGDQSNNSAFDAGAAYVFTRSGTTWSQQAYLKASNTEGEDYFGFALATSGDTIVVGAPQESSNATGVNGDQSNNAAYGAGAAYVFTRDGTIWSQQAYLKASNSGTEDTFGISVAISGDTIGVGANLESSNATGVNGDQSNNLAPRAGASYVFVREGTTWSQQAYLKASNTAPEDWFGNPVAISGDMIVVGAYFEDSNATGVNGDQSNNAAYGAGAAYVFTRNGATWSQQAYLKASNTEAEDGFGLPVAISGDTIVVGARFEDSNATGVNGDQSNNSVIQAGAAYVFFPPPVKVIIGGVEQDAYALDPSESTRQSYFGVNSGRVEITDNIDTALITAERVIYKTAGGTPISFSEMMALPNSQLDTTYWLPWYNNATADLDSQLRFANVSEQLATVHVYIGGQEMSGSPFTLQASESTRVSFPGINAGPVKIVSDHGVPIVAAERVIYKVNNVNTSFSEMMALPNSQLDTTYWLPWYNNKILDTQLRFANISSSTATVRVYISGVEMTGSPFTLEPGASTLKSFPEINSGPVQIESDVPILAGEQVIYKVNNVDTSFSEMMALPNSQLDTTYWMPWYNNKDLDSQLRFANVSTQPATVHVYIGGIEMKDSPFILEPDTSTRQSFFGINSGPVQIVSNIPIVAAERVIHKVDGIPISFSEMMGLPGSLLDTTYWLPWYNNKDLDTQLRFGVP